MDKDEVLNIIKKHIGKNRDMKNIYYTNRTIFFNHSYSISAYKELGEYIKSYNGSPINAIETFIFNMDNLSCKGKNENADYMFSVYADAAKHILDMVL